MKPADCLAMKRNDVVDLVLNPGLGRPAARSRVYFRYGIKISPGRHSAP